MRKNNSGYVIIYVVFVILFLCIVAVGTCTVALNNLKTQTSYIEQMQDRYTAEGNIEQFMAEVCVACEGLAGNEFTSETYALEAAETAVMDKLNEVAGSAISLSAISWEADDRQCIVTAATVVGRSRAVAEIDFTISIDITSYPKGTGVYNENDIEITVDYFKYQITDATSKYLSYTLEGAGGDAE